MAYKAVLCTLYFGVYLPAISSAIAHPGHFSNILIAVTISRLMIWHHTNRVRVFYFDEKEYSFFLHEETETLPHGYDLLRGKFTIFTKLHGL